jgi:threonine synthase
MGWPTGATLIGEDGETQDVNLRFAMLGKLGLVELHYDYSPTLLPAPAAPPEGMWRWRSLLPLEDGPILYPLPIGGTPLSALRGLQRAAGLPNLLLKTETRSPTGSNKDRATALVLEHALRRGADTVTAASTGNVAVSLATGAAACGIRAVIFVPANVGEGKLRLMRAAGADVFRVQGGYEAAFALSRRCAHIFGWADRNTGTNPMTLEAKKTVAFEIWEQMGRDVPDVMVIPVGDGTTLSAIAKGFRELMACGASTRIPRLIGVQAEGCQPLKREWAGEEPVEVTGTIADGIYVKKPANGVTAIRDVRDSCGAFVTVSDDDILKAISMLSRQGGVLAEPAAAAGFAALQPARREGWISPEERVVVLITGSGMKTLHYLDPGKNEHVVQGDISEVEQALHLKRIEPTS